MNILPYPEPSEEVRIEFLGLLSDCLEKQHLQFMPHISEIALMTSKLLQDGNPEMKIKSANFAKEICIALKDKAGPSMKWTVEAMTENLKHQHSKVRKTTLEGLKYVIVCRNAEDFLTDAIPQLKMTANDRSQDVRMKVVQTVEFWLQNMDINSLQNFEKDLMILLLNGVSEG
jgi:hypothetical protein